MTLRHLICFLEVVKQRLNISAASEALHTSQPSVSRQLHELSEELGVELFVRNGKRLVGLTETGQRIAELARETMINVNNIRTVASIAREQARGTITLAATPHVGTDKLLDAVSRFGEQRSDTDIEVRIEPLKTLATLLLNGEIDIGLVVSEPSRHNPHLAYFPVDEWRLVAVAPIGHALLEQAPADVRALLDYRISTYPHDSVPRMIVENAFRDRGLAPKLVCSMNRVDLILRHVANGNDIGIVARTGFDPAMYPELGIIELDESFRSLTSWVVLRRRALLRGRVYEMLALLLPETERAAIDREKDRPMASHPAEAELV